LPGFFASGSFLNQLTFLKKYSMKNTTIINLQKHFSYLMPPNMANDRFADYIFLNQLSSLCAIHFPADTSKEILREVADAYKWSSFFERNAIENEFLSPLIAQLSSDSTGKYINLVPQPLLAVYKEVLSETKKI
jgi:hypothetical protein